MANGRNQHGMKIGYDGSGKSLGSKMFTLIVGSEKHQFYCHEIVLSRSPVFERMCSGSFKESTEQHIELPDDNATVFGRVLDYLYAGVVYGFETPKQGSDLAVLADVYIMAEKYQLNGLKELLITPMTVFLDTTNDKEHFGCFFDAAFKIYHNTPDSDVIFQNFFKMSVTQWLDNKVPAMEADIRRCISDGGKLARDTFEAYYEHMFKTREAKECAEAEIEQLRKDFRDLQINHKELEGNFKTSERVVESFREDHRTHHHPCTQCRECDRFSIRFY